MSTGIPPQGFEPDRVEMASNDAATATATPLSPEEKLGIERLSDDTAREFVQVFKLLADETRVRILHYLLQRDEYNVRTLCELLQQSQPAVSHHLALLKMAGIIECRRDGKHNFYHLVPKRVQAVLNLLFASSGANVRKIRFEDCVLTYQRDEQLGA